MPESRRVGNSRDSLLYVWDVPEEETGMFYELYILIHIEIIKPLSHLSYYLGPHTGKQEPK